MSGTSAFYKTKALPTGVTHAVTCNFLAEDADNLVVVKNDLLEIYTLAVPPETSIQGVGRKRKRKREQKKLFLHSQHQLNGVVMDIKPATFAPNRTSSLLLSFSKAKFSAIHFDRATNTVVTKALYHFEDRGLFTTEFLDEFHCPRIRVDSEHHCAGLLISKRHIAIIPLLVSAQKLDFEPVELEQPGEHKPYEFKREFIVKPTRRSRYKSHLIIDLYTIAVKTVTDFVFLHGYHSPTLLLLHNTSETWAGRIAVKKDTGSLITLTVNQSAKSWDEVCRQDELPWNLYKLFPLPKIGGAIVFSTDVILHFSQNVDFGLSLNRYGDEASSAAVPLARFDPVGNNVISLESVECSMLSDNRLMIGDSQAKLYVLTFGEKSMELKMEASSSAASCLVTLANDYLFIGSSLGDSLVVKYRARKDDGGSRKRQRVAASPNKAKEGDISLASDGKPSPAKPTAAETPNTYHYEIHDSLVNTAPIVMYTPTPSIRVQDDEDDEEAIAPPKDRIDLVACIGQNTNGALATLHEGVRPEVLETEILKQRCNGAWTLHPSRAKALSDPHFHSYLLISHPRASDNHPAMTRPLSTKEEIKSCENETDFFTKGATLTAGNILKRDYMIQIHSEAICVLTNAKMVRELPVLELRKLAGMEESKDDPIAAKKRIVEAHVLDPAIAVLLSDGTVLLVAVSPASSTNDLDTVLGITPADQLTVDVEVTQIVDPEPLVGTDVRKALCIGLFTALPGSPMHSVAEYEPNEQFEEKEAPAKENVLKKAEALAVEEDDDTLLEEMLFGDEEPAPEPPKATKENEADPTAKKKAQEHAGPVTILTIARERGEIEFFALHKHGPALVFRTAAFNMGFQTLPNRICEPDIATNPEVPRIVNPVEVVELRMATLAPGRLRTYVFAFLDTGDLLVYEVFAFDAPREFGLGERVARYSPVRLSRVPHALISRPFTPKDKLGRRQGQGPKEEWTGGKRIVPFSNVAGRAGVFLGGVSPTWIFGHRDFVRAHPFAMSGEGDFHGVSTLTELHNENCNWGIVYFDTNPNGCLFVGTLTEQRESQNAVLDAYDAEMPYRRQKLRVTPHFIARHSTTNAMLAIVSSSKEVLGQEMPTARSLPVFDLKFEARLYDPKTWEVNDSYDEFLLKQDDTALNEHVLCLNEVWLDVPLKTGGTVMKNYICAGTGTMEGEETSSCGRIMLFEIFTRVDDPSLFRLKCTYNRAERGPVTAVDACKGLLTLCIGPKLLLYKWNGNQLIACAFYMARMFCVDCVCLNKYIVVTDVFQSCFLLIWEEETSRLIYLGRDEKDIEAIKSSFLVDGDNINVVLVDQSRNLQILNYEPNRIGSRGGKKLITRADFHTGRHFLWSEQFRSRKLPKDAWELDRFENYDFGLEDEQQQRELFKKKYFNLLAGKCGSVSTLCPIPDIVYRRLSTLAFQLVFKTRHVAGLNPREFRSYKADQRNMRRANKKNVCDGDFLYRHFVNLDYPTQRKLTDMCATSPDVVLNNLHRIALRTKLY